MLSVLKILDGHRPIGDQLRIVVGFPAGIALLCLERGVIADRPVAGDFSVVGVFVVMPVQDSAVILAVSVMIGAMRSEEHTSELQSLMRISYAVFCLKKKNKKV